MSWLWGVKCPCVATPISPCETNFFACFFVHTAFSALGYSTQDQHHASTLECCTHGSCYWFRAIQVEHPHIGEDQTSQRVVLHCKLAGLYVACEVGVSVPGVGFRSAWLISVRWFRTGVQLEVAIQRKYLVHQETLFWIPCITQSGKWPNATQHSRTRTTILRTRTRTAHRQKYMLPPPTYDTLHNKELIPYYISWHNCLLVVPLFRPALQSTSLRTDSTFIW